MKIKENMMTIWIIHMSRKLICPWQYVWAAVFICKAQQVPDDRMLSLRKTRHRIPKLSVRHGGWALHLKAMKVVNVIVTALHFLVVKFRIVWSNSAMNTKASWVGDRKILTYHPALTRGSAKSPMSLNGKSIISGWFLQEGVMSFVFLGKTNRIIPPEWALISISWRRSHNQ